MNHENFNNPFLVLPNDAEIYTRHDSDHDINVLSADYVIEYPGKDQSPPALKSMLLDQSPKGDLILPDNYITLGQALNDSAGQVKSISGSNGSGQLFSELAHGLSNVAQEGIIPKNIGYLNVLFSREEHGAKLLPPVEFIAFDSQDKDQARQHVLDSMWQSLEAGAATRDQLQLITETFGNFVTEFDW